MLAQRGGRGCPGSAVSPRPPPSAPQLGELGCQRPFCLLSLRTRTIGRERGWPDSAVSAVRCGLAARPGLPRAGGTVGAGAGQLGLLKPVNPSPAWPNFLRPSWLRSYALDSSEDSPVPLSGKATAEALPPGL